MTELQERLVTDNMKLVYYMANKLSQTEFVRKNKDDLASEGMTGLVKAARAFDPAKGIKFATFAGRCINNEMLMFMRRSKKHEGNISLYSAVGSDDEGRELLLMDTLSVVESNIERAERAADAANDLNAIMSSLSERDRRLVECIRAEMKQRQIAEKFGISQSYVSRLKKKLREKAKHQIARCNCG